jgi:glycosyltransferase involved in cell wall biosynthesis
LLVVGEGREREDMEERALSLGLADSVRFTSGVAPELKRELLAVADVAVVPRLPSALASSPAGILELMVSGKAIVASREGQVAELLVDEQTALLVEPGNREALARAMERLLGEADLRRRLGEHARFLAKRDHSWTDYARQLTRIYESVLGRSNGLKGGNPASSDSGR